jgi:geranylgeranylglycerol-phosphate geranylgeranyltransferase
MLVLQLSEQASDRFPGAASLVSQRRASHTRWEPLPSRCRLAGHHCQSLESVLGACAVAFGAFAVGPTTARVLLLMAITVAHDAATNLVGAIRDLEGDQAIGCRTAAVVYGATRAVDLSAGFAATSMLLGALLMRLLRPNGVATALYGLVLCIAASAYGPLLIARRAPARRLALETHKRLVPERVVLSSAFIATAVPGAALLLLAIALPASLGLQRLMRARYEPVDQRLVLGGRS